MSKKPKLLMEGDVGEQGCLLLRKLNEYQSPVTTTILFEQTGLNRVKIRRVMARLALFRLIDEVSSAGKPNTYFITKIGIEFVKRLPVEEHTVSNAVIIEKPEVNQEPPSLVLWLRQKADELHAMADHLSHYE